MSDTERSKKSYLKHIARNIGISSGAGYVFGFLTGTAAGLITGEFKTGAEIGVKTGICVAGAGFWVTELNYTINNAEPSERPLLHKLKGALATAEGTLAMGIPAGLISYSTDNPWWLVGGAVFGGLSGLLQFRERFRKKPDLIFPDGNSVIEDTRFPSEYMESRLPKVYRAGSLADIIDFRKANQDQIVRWAGDLPTTSIDVPHQLMVNASSPVNAIFITNVRHFPAADPETGSQMVLRDRTQVKEGESISVNPLKESHFFWSYHPTNFEDRPLVSFSDRRWDRFKEHSWERQIVILAQYQTTKNLSPEIKPENIVDRFWLIDVSGEGIRVRRKDKIPQISSVPIRVVNPGNI